MKVASVKLAYCLLLKLYFSILILKETHKVRIELEKVKLYKLH